MKESITVSDLIRILREKGNSDEYIINTLRGIIHSHVLYGGCQQEQINHQYSLALRIN
jgi:hypothetical protein